MNTNILKSWLNLITGRHSEQVIQRMQEQLQPRLDEAFNEATADVYLGKEVDVETVVVKNDILGILTFKSGLEYYGQVVNDQKHGKAKVVWKDEGHKVVLTGFFFHDKLVGNVSVMHLGKQTTGGHSPQLTM
jgi:hypothetical protein